VALEDLGLESDTLQSLKEVLARPQGMILVTGPTGSGKTSTLYAALNHLRHETTNIVTVEDPVEYRLAGINQVAVSEKAGLSFAAGLRSILRQDPDVIMVGEIRDLETAKIAFQASQTGHLVLSTLHTNDAPSALTRLVEMGVPAYVVSSSLVAVQAQRLVRRLCVCATPQPDGRAVPKGCDACRYTGFKGRMGVYELMRITPRVRSVLMAGASDDVVRDAAQAAGMRTMFQDGEQKVARGMTTPEEVRRVAPPDDPKDVDTAQPPAETPLPAALSADARNRRPPRILVTEDDDALREIVRESLESEHYEVLTAANGKEALAIVYQQRPDLVLTDLRMPVMDGLELLKRLRGNLDTCQIPVLFLTVVGDLDAEVQALDLGADDYISKPIERVRLLGRVRRALFRAHLLRSAS
jgi:type IV pilus assembly protein PilB